MTVASAPPMEGGNVSRGPHSSAPVRRDLHRAASTAGWRPDPTSRAMDLTVGRGGSGRPPSRQADGGHHGPLQQGTSASRLHRHGARARHRCAFRRRSRAAGRRHLGRPVRRHDERHIAIAAGQLGGRLPARSSKAALPLYFGAGPLAFAARDARPMARGNPGTA